MREALQRLHAEGWADPRPAQGAFVHEPTEEEAGRLLTVRTLPEAEAPRLAASNADSEGVQALEAILAEGLEAVRSDDADAAVAPNARFRATVREPAGNAVLAGPAAQVDQRVRWLLHAGRPAARRAVLDRAP